MKVGANSTMLPHVQFMVGTRLTFFPSAARPLHEYQDPRILAKLSCKTWLFCFPFEVPLNELAALTMNVFCRDFILSFYQNTLYNLYL